MKKPSSFPFGICLLTFVCSLILIQVASATSVTLTTGTSWLVPPGVTSVDVECWGGGGAGGSATKVLNNAWGGGGAGGAYAKKSSISVTAGNPYSYSIGAGGVSSLTSNAVVNGGDTYFIDASTVLAKGGAGGVTISNISASTGGAGGVGSSVGCIGDVSYAGGSGAAGASSYGGGGGGGANDASIGGLATTSTGGSGGTFTITAGGAGANGPATANAIGTNGFAPGGGGSGARASSVNSKAGGNGGNGQIIITYTASSIIYSYKSTAATADWSSTTLWQRNDGAGGGVFTNTTIPPSAGNSTNVEIIGGSTVAVTGASSIPNLTIDSGGKLTTVSGGLTASQVTVNGGTLDVTNFSGNSIGAVSVLNGGNINGTSGTLSGTGYTMATGTASANLGGASAALAVSGTVALNGTNTYGGATTVSSGGILQLGNGSALGTTNAGTTVSSGGLLDLNGQTIVAEALTIAGGSSTNTSLTNSSATAASWSGLVTLTGTTYVGGAGDITLSGGIAQSSSTARNLGKLNENTLTLSAPSTYLGITTIRAGTVRVSAPSSLSPGQLQTGGSTSDSSTLDLASPGVYGMTNLSLGGIIHVTASGGAASLTFSNASLLTGSGSKTVDAGTNVTVYFGGMVDLYGTQSPTNRNWNLQGAGAIVLNAAITNTDVSGTYFGGLRVLNSVTATINGMNTYNGNTTVDGGRLIFGAGATIPNSTNLTIAAGGVLDVSAGGFTLGTNRNFGNNLNNTNAVGSGIVSGSLNASAGVVALYYTNGVSPLLVSNGTFTLAANTPVTVTNIGTALGAGSYPLIATGAGGSVAGTAPTNLTVAPGGLVSGATASLSISNNELYLVVSGGTLTAPVIDGFTPVSGGGVALNFSGPTGQTWEILTSTNVTLPVASWSIVTSGSFTGAAVNYTNNSPTDPQRFYRVTSP